MMKLVTVIAYQKKILKIYKSPDIFLSSADVTFFHRKSPNFTISSNTDIDYILTHNFWFFFTFFESLKVFLINMFAILMSAKLEALAFLKIKVFWNTFLAMTSTTKFYHVIHIISQMWSCDQSLVTLSFYERSYNINFTKIWPEKTIFWRVFGLNLVWT